MGQGRLVKTYVNTEPPKAPFLSAPDQKLDIDIARKPGVIPDFLKGLTGLGEGVLDKDTSKSELLGEMIQTAFPVLAITRFGKVADRVKKTEKNFRTLAKQMFKSGYAAKNPEDAQKVLSIAKKYPRTLAHVSGFDGLDEYDSYGRLGNITDWNDPKGVGRIGLNYNVHTNNPNPSYNLPNTFAHEMTHAAQVLGSGPDNRVMEDAYTMLHRNYGYEENPMEKSARLTGYTHDPKDMWLKDPANKKEAVKQLGREVRPLTQYYIKAAKESLLRQAERKMELAEGMFRR